MNEDKKSLILLLFGILGIVLIGLSSVNIMVAYVGLMFVLLLGIDIGKSKKLIEKNIKDTKRPWLK